MRSSTRVRLVRLTALAVLVAPLLACDVSVGEGGFNLGLVSGRAQDESVRTYAVAAGGRIEIVNTNGRITAEPADGGTVEVTIERRARATTDEAAREMLQRIEIREETDGGNVRLETRTPSSSGFGGHEVRYLVRVPSGVHVDLRTTNGGVQVTGLDGEIRARTTNGGIQGRALRTSVVEGRVTNGGVDVELATALEADGQVQLDCTNGGVRLALPADSRAAVSARAVNGGVSIEGLRLEATGEQSRRRIEGTLNGGGARVALSTTNGGVRIRGS
jgi:hypothetical protein